MKRLLGKLWGALSSPILAPLVVGFFFLAYIAIAFFTEEVLITLIAFTARSRVLALILALVPLNFACRLVAEGGAAYRRMRLCRAAGGTAVDPALFDETVHLDPPVAGSGLEDHLRGVGFRTRGGGSVLAAWRGISLAPARICLLAAAFCLFAGILLSVTSRSVSRQALIEGEQLPPVLGVSGIVERVTLFPSGGPILLKDLAIEVGSGQGGEIRKLGVYPPARIGGAFVYPRYLGVAMRLSFAAPDLPGGSELSDVFPLYPPGKEASAKVPGSPYKLSLTLKRPGDGSDPYITGKLAFVVKVLKGADVVAAGELPRGGELIKDGYRVAIPDARRMVITDFVVDVGVLLIWAAGFLFLVGGILWLAVRLALPRREMLFVFADGAVRAFSRAEGRRRKHAGIFHEVLDFLVANRTGRAEG